MAAGTYKARKREQLATNRTVNIAHGSGAVQDHLFQELYIIVSGNAANETVDLFDLPKGYVVTELVVRTDAAVAATVTLDVGLIDKDDDAIVDDDAYISDEDAAAAAKQFIYPKAGGPIGLLAQDEDCVVQLTFDTLVTPTAGTKIYFSMRMARSDE